MGKRGKMFHFNFEGLDAYIDELGDLGESSVGMAKRALYDGVAVVVDVIEKAVEDLPYHPTMGISHEQKQGLRDGLGLSRMKPGKKRGSYYVKIGWSGNNSVHTKEHPGGQPNAMIAAAVNSGTSVQSKYPYPARKPTRFITKAVRKARQRSYDAMRNRFDEDLKSLKQKHEKR